MDFETRSESVSMILALIFLFIQKATTLQVGFIDEDLGTNIGIILFILIVLAIAVVLGRGLQNRKKR